MKSVKLWLIINALLRAPKATPFFTTEKNYVCISGFGHGSINEQYNVP